MRAGRGRGAPRPGERRRAALPLPCLRTHLPGTVAAARRRPGCASADRGPGPQRQWHPRHGAGAGHLDQHGAGAPEKKVAALPATPVHPAFLTPAAAAPDWALHADEMWSYVGAKKRPRWLWWVEERTTGRVVAYVFGRRTHATFRRLRAVLASLGRAVARWFTDAWWAYVDTLPARQHTVGKAALQRLERKHLTLRTRLKRLARKTSCFSKSQFLHDGLIALFIHHFFFGLKQYY